MNADGLHELERGLAAIERIADQDVADTARRAIEAVLGLHREGLDRMLAVLGRVDPDELRELAQEPAVAALLLVHDLHPESLRARVERAVGQVRRALDASIELLAADEAAVRVRVAGGHEGAIEHALEEALLEFAPDAGPLHVARTPAHDAFVPLTRLVRRDEPRDLGWRRR